MRFTVSDRTRMCIGDEQLNAQRRELLLLYFYFCVLWINTFCCSQSHSGRNRVRGLIKCSMSVLSSVEFSVWRYYLVRILFASFVNPKQIFYWSFILFVVYIPSLSAVEIIWGIMTGLLINNGVERIWKEAVIAWLFVLSQNLPGRKAKYLSQVSRSPSRDLNLTCVELEARVINTQTLTSWPNFSLSRSVPPWNLCDLDRTMK